MKQRKIYKKQTSTGRLNEMMIVVENDESMMHKSVSTRVSEDAPGSHKIMRAPETLKLHRQKETFFD